MKSVNQTSPGETSIALEVVDVSKSFGAMAVLHGISFELSQGEFLTMLGPSGSGKTTTLRIIAGFEQPNQGEVRLHGRNVVHVPAYRRNIGMVFQDYALFPHMNVLDNVAFPLEARGVRAKERRRAAEEMLSIVNLSGFESRLPRQLSGGQQQRVALARALVFNPELVLLDEPLGALDKKLRGTMQLEILRIAKKLGATVISVTHDQEEALVMSDRIAVFSQGQLAQIGTPKQLYEAPKTKFVADFIGESNLLEGRLISGMVAGNGWCACLPKGRAVELAEGEAATMVLRPENIAVRALGGDVAGAAESAVNRLVGTLREIIYFGVEYRLLVASRDGSVVQVRSRDMSAIEALGLDAEVELSWQEESVAFLRG